MNEGDIVSIDYIRNNSKLYVNGYKLLNRPFINPNNKIDSAYYKLNKNNKKLISILYGRQKFFQSIRAFFTNRDFLEINSSSLVESPGIERHIEPFATDIYDFFGNKNQFYLPTSPEFALKEVLTGGVEKIFEIAKVFRNREDNSKIHKHEFYMLEWYRAYSDYEVIMDDCFNLLNFISKNIYDNDKIIWNGYSCELSKNKKIKLKDLFTAYNIDLDFYMTDPEKFIKDICDILKISKKEIIENNLTKEDLFFKFYLNNIEQKLGFDNPVIVYEYPVEMASLSRVCKDNELYAERFEMYLFGVEIANAYGELIDPVIQEKRFIKDLEFRKAKSIYKLELPVKFLNNLKYGLPPCAGIALGLERLFMMFEGLDSINETNLF